MIPSVNTPSNNKLGRMNFSQYSENELHRNLAIRIKNMKPKTYVIINPGDNRSSIVKVIVNHLSLYNLDSVPVIFQNRFLLDYKIHQT